MSRYTRSRESKDSAGMSKGLYSKVEQEMAEGYLEVEITGMSMSRLLCAYGVMLRSAWSYTLGSVRSMLRATPVH